MSSACCRWRDDDARDGETDLKASKRRRASPVFEPRAKFPRPRSMSMSPQPMREPGMLRSVKSPCISTCHAKSLASSCIRSLNHVTSLKGGGTRGG